MKIPVGTVSELWRYPVKSMAGDRIQQASVKNFGVAYDRCWAVRDDEKGELTTVRKLPKLLLCKATYDPDQLAEQVTGRIPHVRITLPDGRVVRSDDEDRNQWLSAFLERRVSLWPLQPASNWRFYLLKSMLGEQALKKQFGIKNALPDMSSMSWRKMLELSVFATPLGRYYDAYPLHIVTSNSLKHLQQFEPDGDFVSQRFRPNIFVDSHDKQSEFEEFEWVGGRLTIGDTVIACQSKTVRCSMPAQPQVGVGKDAKVLRALERHSGRHLGINATVVASGTIRVGDQVLWQPERQTSPSRILRPLSSNIRNATIQASLKVIDRLAKRS